MAHRFTNCLVAASLALGAIASPALAGAEEGERSKFYGTAGIGYSMIRDADWDYEGGASYTDADGDIEIDNGLGYQFGIGYDFGNKTRAEFTYSSHNGDLDKVTESTAGVADEDLDGDVSLESFMISVYRDLGDGNSKFTPYIGAGIGTTSFELDDVKTKDGFKLGDWDDSAFSWQLKGGVSYELTEKMDGYTEVTYLNVGEVGESSGDQEVDIESSSVGIFTGVRFRF